MKLLFFQTVLSSTKTSLKDPAKDPTASHVKVQGMLTSWLCPRFPVLLIKPGRHESRNIFSGASCRANTFEEAINLPRASGWRLATSPEIPSSLKDTDSWTGASGGCMLSRPQALRNAITAPSASPFQAHPTETAVLHASACYADSTGGCNAAPWLCPFFGLGLLGPDCPTSN